MSFANDLTLQGIFVLPSRTHDEWLSTDPIVPASVMIYITDHQHVKIGDGVHTYSQLSYLGVDTQLTSEYLEFLRLYNQSGGIVLLNEHAKIDDQFLPNTLHDNLGVREYRTYTELLAETNPGGIAVVINASDDSNVGSVLTVMYHYRKSTSTWIPLYYPTATTSSGGSGSGSGSGQQNQFGGIQGDGTIPSIYEELLIYRPFDPTHPDNAQFSSSMFPMHNVNTNTWLTFTPLGLGPTSGTDTELPDYPFPTDYLLNPTEFTVTNNQKNAPGMITYSSFDTLLPAKMYYPSRKVAVINNTNPVYFNIYMDHNTVFTGLRFISYAYPCSPGRMAGIGVYNSNPTDLAANKAIYLENGHHPVVSDPEFPNYQTYPVKLWLWEFTFPVAVLAKAMTIAIFVYSYPMCISRFAFYGFPLDE
jgi:hypothetical protein